ncbi:putative uncharacterized protein DDB_G0292292 isoform X2 [Anabas testudineus]|uniref:putative uncharacterized protein DDB_G0292292 isoform X2 n=1 Tax=Anabas testudineus TaxID=64144 RepID=UPI000E45982D|nr:putative uncharacterized protein DDB_G0292292 isoform X2 [Anabas testudineus]
MDTFSDTQRTRGQNHTCSNMSHTQSLDLGVYVHIENNFDGSLLNTQLEEANDYQENNQTECPNINLQPEVQNNNRELVEKDSKEEQYKNPIARSDPDLVIGTAVGLKDSTSAVISQADNLKSQRPLSMLVCPPPLPPKNYKRSSAFEKPLVQSPNLKVFNEVKPMNSQTCQMSSLLCGVKENNQCSDLANGNTIPDIHNIGTFENVLKMESKYSPKPSPPRYKPPIKPPRLNNPAWPETEGRKQTRKQEVEQSKNKEKVGDRDNKHQQDLSERNEKMEENEETSGKESHLDDGKLLQQIFTEKEEGGEDGQSRGKENEDPSEELTIMEMTNNSTLLRPDEKPDTAMTNGTYKTTISAKPESTIPLKPSPKPRRNDPPIPPIKPAHLSITMRAVIKKQRESWKQEEEQWRDNLLDEETDEYKEEGNEESKDPRDTEMTAATMTETSSELEDTVKESIPDSSVNQEVELPSKAQRFSLMSPYRNSPKPLNTSENQTLLQSQLPGTQQQNREDEQFNPGRLPQVAPVRVNDVGVDSDVETLRLTENYEDIHLSMPINSKLSSKHLQTAELLEDTEEIDETVVDGELRQTRHKHSAGRRMINFAKKIVCKLKEARDEKRRFIVEEGELDGTEVTQDDTGHCEEERMCEEGEIEWTDEDALSQLAVTETQKRIKRRSTVTDSLFGSFRVSSPVKLVAELLSGEEWSPFLSTEKSSTPDSPPCQTQLEDTAQPSENLQITSSDELDLAPDMTKGSHVVSGGENVYEDINLSHVNTDEQQEVNTPPCTTTPEILTESDANQMSLRTKDIYETVELIQPAKTQNHFTDIKSQGVLDSSVQKYLIKLCKKRLSKQRKQKKRRGRSHDASSLSQVFIASIFYSVPPAGGEEEQLSTIKCAGNSPTAVARTNEATKEETLQRAAHPKEE